MNVKKESIHAKDDSKDSGTIVDFNHAKIQKRMLDYIKHGVPTSDPKHGHHVKLQTKVHPIQSDILEGIREKAPKSYWKSQSQLLRSVISLGSYVMLRFLEKADEIPDLRDEFYLLSLLNKLSKRSRRDETLVEARKVLENPLVKLDYKEITRKLEELEKLSDE